MKTLKKSSLLYLLGLFFLTNLSYSQKLINSSSTSLFVMTTQFFGKYVINILCASINFLSKNKGK